MRIALTKGTEGKSPRIVAGLMPILIFGVVAAGCTEKDSDEIIPVRVGSSSPFGNGTFSGGGRSSVPDSPVSLNATAVSSVQVDLTWTDTANDETSFRVQRRTGSTGPFLPVSPNLPANTTSFTDNSVMGGVSYEYQVLAFNGFGASDPSNTATVTTPALGGDECATAVSVGTLPATNNFDASTATMSGSDPSVCNGGGEASVWFTHTAAATSTITVDTGGSNFDTVLQVFSGGCGSLTSLGCNDDGMGLGLQSRVSFAATAGTTYRFVVTSFSGAGGNIVLNTAAAPPAPAFDDCATPMTVAVPSATMFDASMATEAGTDPGFPCSGGNPRFDTVWFTFTAATTQSVIVDTFTSSYDTLLAVWTGTCGTLTNVGCNDDTAPGTQSQVTFMAMMGTTYLIEVAAFTNGNGSTGTLNITLPPPGPPNDPCAMPQSIAENAFNQEAIQLDTTMATTEGTDPLLSCFFGGPNQANNSVWYTHTASASQMLTSDTEGSNYDTEIGVFTGTCGTLTEIACDEDGGTGLLSTLDFMANMGTTYLFDVTSFNAGGGMLEFRVFPMGGNSPVPPADACADARLIAVGQALFQNTANATTDPTDPMLSCFFGGPNQGNNSVWFTHTAAVSQMLTSDTEQSNYDTEIGVFTGTCGTLTEIACDEDSGTGLLSTLDFMANMGTTYLFDVTSFNAGGGDLVFRLFPMGGMSPMPGPLPPPPPPEVILGQPVSGRVPAAGESSQYNVALSVGETYTFQVDVDDPSQHDTILELRNASGAIVAYNDDLNFAAPGSSANELNSQIAGFTPVSSGIYTLTVRGYGEQAPAFTLTTSLGGSSLGFEGPRATVVRFKDVDQTNTASEGDAIMVAFDAAITLNTSDPDQAFELALAGDSFGTGATVSVLPGQPTVATIVLGADPQLNLGGSFDKTDPAGASGLMVTASSVVASSKLGEPALPVALDIGARISAPVESKAKALGN